MFIFAFSLVLTVLAIATYGQSLIFTFWKDDWIYFWNSLYSTKLVTPILLHPGTYIEFQVFARTFGTHVFWWQLSGIVLKITASLAVVLMAWGITRSKFTAVLSGIFFATTSVGLEGTIWASAHVVNLVVLFLALGTYFAATKKIFWFLFFTVLGIAADPARAVPIVLIDFLILKPPVIPSLTAGTGVFLIAAFLFRKNILEAPMIRFILLHWHEPPVLFSKIHVIGQFFQSLYHLFTSWFLTPNHYINEASHGIYNPLQARLGAVIIFVLFLLKKYRIFLLWILLFYLPNWASEPRLIATGNHRYLTIASVGFICIVADFIAHIKPKYLSLVIMTVFIAFNVDTAHVRISELAMYRSKTIVDSVWNKIETIVPNTQPRKLFIYFGEEPAKTNIFDISGSVPYAVRHQITSIENFPFVTNNFEYVAAHACTYAIYGFDINNNGEIRDLTADLRRKFICASL